MKNDNLTVRERLIDFISWLDDKEELVPSEDEYPRTVDNYLKSINQSSNEALTLAPIEQKDKKCEKHYKECRTNECYYKGTCEDCGWYY
jgi:hypothetical protein